MHRHPELYSPLEPTPARQNRSPCKRGVFLDTLFYQLNIVYLEIAL
jgi:hypothetical protein